MTCRCKMCGVNNAGKIHRGAYFRVGLKTSETMPNEEKDRQRKIRRKRERDAWEYDYLHNE